MATRFGGRYSPRPEAGDARPEPAPAIRAQAEPPVRPGFRTWLLFLLPLPLILRAFAQGAGGLILTLAALALLLFSAWLTREGERAHREYARRRTARRPAFPRKLAGALFMGLGLAAASLADAGTVAAAGLGLLGAALHVAAFGPDPLRDKGMEGIDSHSRDRAARAVDRAEGYLKEMSEAISRVGERRLQARVAGFAATARTMFRRVEEDPRDLSAARKYLTVYLLGARDATVKFADLYGRNREPQARADYAALLDDLEAGFARQNQRLLSDNRDDLNVEIEVLRERLQREGVELAVSDLTDPARPDLTRPDPT